MMPGGSGGAEEACPVAEAVAFARAGIAVLAKARATRLAVTYPELCGCRLVGRRAGKVLLTTDRKRCEYKDEN
jgi:hypothetical protein